MKYCPKCNHELLTYTYEQTHSGWGFPNYKTEYFRHAKCMNPDCVLYRRLIY